MKTLYDYTDLYAGQSFYIIGKGVSLQYLTKNYFHTRNPVIALNDSILIVQELGLRNDLFSLQKDGCGIKKPHDKCKVQEPNFRHMVEPKNNVLVILEATRSQYCLPAYKNRLIVNMQKELGFENNSELSIRVAIKLAIIMGAVHLRIVSCDSLTNGNLETYDFGHPLQEGIKTFYEYAIPLIKKDLENISHAFITPERQGEINGY